MPTITFGEWGLGLDLRKGPSTSDANRLRVLTNAYVTQGKTIRKRHGCQRVQRLQPGTVGLFAGLGKLNTFQMLSSAYPTAAVHTGTMVVNRVLTDEVGLEDGGIKLREVMNCEPFNGFLYVVAKQVGVDLLGSTYRHHYLDAGPSTHVDDAPHRQGVTKAASKIWCSDNDVVRYCATNNPRDWTTADDAGFLPVGLQQSGSKDSIAVGNYQNRLVVFFGDSSQVWEVDADPTANRFVQSVDIGTSRPYAHQNMAGDVFFQSPGGVRTITRQAQTETLVDSDVGSPIDRELISGALLDPTTTKAQYWRGTGQYWLYSGKKAVVFTYSRSSKISAWSLYEFPFTLDYLDELDTVLYIRSGDTLYAMDAAEHTDDGTVFQVEIETAYADFKNPGLFKQIFGMDAVTTGPCEISHRFDPRTPVLETSPPALISGDTRPGTLIPVELVTTNLSTVIRNRDDKEFELHSLSYRFEKLE